MRKAPSNLLRSLVSGLPTAQRRKRMIFVFQYYIDDSEMHQEPVSVLAGHFATYEQWETFSDEWLSILQESPALPYLKMSQAMSFRGPFTKWDRADRDDRIQRLLNCAIRNTSGVFSLTMNSLAYREILSPWIPGETYKDKYASMATFLVGEMLRSHREACLAGPVDFVFDSQPEQVANFARWWDEIKANIAPDDLSLISGFPLFRDEKDVLPLQAADMAAWIIRHRNETTETGKPFRSPFMMRLPKGYMMNHMYMDEAFMIRMRDRIIARSEPVPLPREPGEEQKYWFPFPPSVFPYMFSPAPKPGRKK